MQDPALTELSRGTLAWRNFGDPQGRPLIFFHGWPGSSAQCWLLDAAAQRHGFRGFAIDRPGIGNSPISSRQLSDWPAHVCEFASAHDVSKFAVLGLSGGGPYAVACAALCPESICAVAVVCGAPPIAELADVSRLHPIYRTLLRIFRRSPNAVRRFFRIVRPMMLWRDALAFLPPLRIILPKPDAQALELPSHFEGVFNCQSDAFLDVDGLYSDAEIYAKPWGFRPEDIRIPVQFWHGRDDANFHYSLAEQLAARVPKSSLRIVENEGHFSLPINQADAILAALAKSC